MWCTKSSGSVAFRIEPEAFEYESESEVRPVKGWFFPTSTERRIAVRRANFDLILRCLDHAYKTTVEL